MPKRYEVSVIIKGQDQASPALGAVQNSLAGFAGSLKGMAIVAGGIALQKGLSMTVGKIMEIGQESFYAAARIEELEKLLHLVGGRAGHSATELDRMVDSIKKLGIRTDVSLSLLTQFARYNLEVADAQKLARVAQDAATHSKQDSSQALQGLLHGIMTYNSLVLRTYGVTLNVGEAFRKYADANDLSAKSLTSAQKAQAVLNAVLKEGESLAGSYEISMESVGKRIRSLDRHFYEMSVTLGEPFLEAGLNVVKIIEDLIKGFRWAVEEGGPFHDILQGVGAMAAIATEALRNLVHQGVFMLKALADQGRVLSGVMGGDVPRGVQRAEEAFIQASPNMLTAAMDTVSGIARQFIQLSEDALVWGINTATEFATGLIEGAAEAIVAAMNYISGLLSSWLSASSPPKIAPDLPEWGAKAFTEYLKGFSQAEFSVLERLQGPIQSALSTLADLGDIAAEDVGPTFAALSQQLAAALSEFAKTGKVDEQLFEQLEAAGGRFGKELADLARKQFELAAGVKEVEAAEKKLNAARAAQDQARRTVASLVDEYNALQKAGASEEVLKAKRAELQAGHDALLQARVAEKAAAKQKAAAEERVDVLKQQLDLQERLVRQLIAMTKAQEETTKKVSVAPAATQKAVKAAVSARKALELKKPEFPAPDLGNIVTAFDEMKEKIRQKLEDMFGPALAKWQALADSPVWSDLLAAWNKFALAWDGFYTEYIGPTIDNIIARIPEMERIINKAFTAMEAVFAGQTMPALQHAFDNLTAALARLGIDWDDVFTALEFIAVGVIGTIVTQFVVFIGVITAVINGIATMVERVTEHLNTFLVGAQFMSDGLIAIFDGLTKIISGMLTGNMEKWNEGFEQFVNGVLKLITGFVVSTIGWFEIMVAGVWGLIEGFVVGIVGFFESLFKQLVGGSIVPELVKKVVDGFAGLVDDLVGPNGLVPKMVADIIDKIQKTDWKQLGKDIIQGVIDGVGKMYRALAQAFVDVVNAAIDKFKEIFGIASAAKKVTPEMGADMAVGLMTGWERALAGGLRIPGVTGGVGSSVAAGGTTRHDHYNLTIHSQAQTEQVASDFAIMRTLAGAGP
jgi:hypothetical protein